MDNPSLTQPLMYKTIEKERSVPDTYAAKLQVSCSPPSHVTLLNVRGSCLSFPMGIVLIVLSDQEVKMTSCVWPKPKSEKWSSVAHELFMNKL